MFSNLSTDTVEFPSCWKTVKQRQDNSTQTSAIQRHTAECQTKKARNAECQTETLLNMMEANSLNQKQSGSDQKLLTFLKEVEPIVSRQLKVNTATSHIYANVYKQKEKQLEIGISCEYVLEEESVGSIAGDDCVEVTCVSWSCTGATIAVAYGTNENIAWSENRSYLCLWNLDRPKMNRKTCDQKIELESSIQVISFHPQLQGFIAVGLFSGAVLIWNISRDEISYSASNHEDPVTCLHWLEEKNPKNLLLLSGSSDGKLITWKYRKDRESFPLKVGKEFKIKGANLARWAGVKSAGAVGITALSVASEFYHDDAIIDRGFSTSSTVIVGSESGAVIKCSLDSDDESNPVAFTYESHVGPVYSVDWSPFHRHLFLTCSTDQTCRVYHSLQATPLREFYPEEAVGGKDANYLFCALWSRTRPKITYIVGTRGRIEAFDIVATQSIAYGDANDRDGKPCVVNDMKLNFSRKNLIATGSLAGIVHIWQIGAQLFEAEDRTDEISSIDELAHEALAQD